MGFNTRDTSPVVIYAQLMLFGFDGYQPEKRNEVREGRGGMSGRPLASTHGHDEREQGDSGQSHRYRDGMEGQYFGAFKSRSVHFGWHGTLAVLRIDRHVGER